MVDQVDHHLAVPRFYEPALGRPLGPQARVSERTESAVDVALADHEVEVLGRLGSTARPSGEASAEGEGNLCVAQRRPDLLQGQLDPLELLAMTGHVVLVPGGSRFSTHRDLGRAPPGRAMSSLNGNQPRRPGEPATVRIAAAGDIHCRESDRSITQEAFGKLGERADLVLLAGDLTMHGTVEEAAVLADACRELGRPVVAVL